jgi:hypothetical protein
LARRNVTQRAPARKGKRVVGRARHEAAVRGWETRRAREREAERQRQERLERRRAARRRRQREERARARELSERAKRAARTRAKRRALLRRAAEQTPEERAMAMREVARQEGLLPKRRRRRRRIDSSQRRGVERTFRYGRPLDEALITEAVHDAVRFAGKHARRAAFFLAVIVLVTYGRLVAGGSPKLLVPVWWAPDAGEAAVVHASTGVKASLDGLESSLEMLLDSAVAPDESAGVVLEATVVSAWTDRTRKEKRRWKPRGKKRKKSKKEQSKRQKTRGAHTTSGRPRRRTR